MNSRLQVFIAGIIYLISFSISNVAIADLQHMVGYDYYIINIEGATIYEKPSTESKIKTKLP